MNSMVPVASGDALLTEAQTAALLGVPASVLQSQRQRGTGPDFVRIGNRVRYNPLTVAAYIRAHKRHGDVRPAKPGTPSLPQRMAELLAAQVAHAHGGAAAISPALMRRLRQAVGPHELAVTLALCPQAHVLPNRSVRLPITPHASVPAEELGTLRSVPVDYDTRTGKFHSPLAEGRGLDRLCAHVWRLQGNTDDMAARRLLALIGAAYLDMLAEEAGG